MSLLAKNFPFAHARNLALSITKKEEQTDGIAMMLQAATSHLQLGIIKARIQNMTPPRPQAVKLSSIYDGLRIGRIESKTNSQVLSSKIPDENPHSSIKVRQNSTLGLNTITPAKSMNKMFPILDTQIYPQRLASTAPHKNPQPQPKKNEYLKTSQN